MGTFPLSVLILLVSIFFYCMVESAIAQALSLENVE